MIHWQPVDRPPALSRDAIHVWRLPEQAPVDAVAWLDAHESARLKAIVRDAHRIRWLTARAGLKQVLAGYLGTTPDQVAISVPDSGKPELTGGPCFNLSHTGGLALLAVAPQAVGIDVEACREVPRALGIAERVFDPDSVRRLCALHGTDRDTSFLQAWTAMEARQKCAGEGVFGRRIATSDVGNLAFDPDHAHVGHLCWADGKSTPNVSWMRLRSCCGNAVPV